MLQVTSLIKTDIRRGCAALMMFLVGRSVPVNKVAYKDKHTRALTFQLAHIAIDDAALHVRVLDRRIIISDKILLQNNVCCFLLSIVYLLTHLYKLNRQRTLADTAGADNDETIRSLLGRAVLHAVTGRSHRLECVHKVHVVIVCKCYAHSLHMSLALLRAQLQGSKSVV